MKENMVEQAQELGLDRRHFLKVVAAFGASSVLAQACSPTPAPTPIEYLQASRARSLMMAKMHEYMQDVDAYIEITWTSQWDSNVCGYPLVVVPCGFLDSGRPASISFVGKLFGEAELLAVAKAYQDATGFHLMHPQL